MSATTMPRIDTNVIVRGLKTSHMVELEGHEFILRMTPSGAYELAQAILTVIGEIR